MSKLMIAKALAVLTCLALQLSSDSCEAGLIVEVLDTEIQAGSTGTVDVVIRTDARDSLSFANYSFVISPSLTAGSALEFRNPTDLSEANDADYVFPGNPGGLVGNATTALTYSGAGSAISTMPVALGTNNRLLVRLDVESVLAPGQTPSSAAGEEFMISLSDPRNPVFFRDGAGTLVNNTEITLTAGTVTLTSSATAVPEPTALLLFAASGLPLVCRRRRR